MSEIGPEHGRVEGESAREKFAHYIKFLAVGAFNTAFGYGLYLALLFLNLPYWLAWALALILALLVSFFLSGRFVFGPVQYSRLMVFISGWAAIYGINIALIEALVAALGVSVAIAPLIVLPVNIVLSYLMQRYLVFRRAKS